MLHKLKYEWHNYRANYHEEMMNSIWHEELIEYKKCKIKYDYHDLLRNYNLKRYLLKRR